MRFETRCEASHSIEWVIMSLPRLRAGYRKKRDWSFDREILFRGPWSQQFVTVVVQEIIQLEERGIVGVQASSCLRPEKHVEKGNQNSARSLPLRSANACFSCNVRCSHLEITASILNSSVSCSTDRVSAMYWLLIHSAACLVQSSLVQ